MAAAWIYLLTQPRFQGALTDQSLNRITPMNVACAGKLIGPASDLHCAIAKSIGRSTAKTERLGLLRRI